MGTQFHIFLILWKIYMYKLRWKQQAYIIPIMKQAGRRTQQECFLTGSLPLHCSLSACLALVSSCLNLVFYIHALSLFVQCKTHNASLSSLVVKFAPTRDLLLMCALLYYILRRKFSFEALYKTRPEARGKWRVKSLSNIMVLPLIFLLRRFLLDELG